MRFSRFFHLLFFTYLILTWFGLVSAYAQEEDTEEEIELRPVNYVSETYGFGLALPDGYLPFDFSDEESGSWTLNILGEMIQPSAIINVEPLPEDVNDVAGFWQLMKDRDRYMERNITYEKVDSVAGVGAIQARVEDMQVSEYILAITWVFVNDGHGFVISAYPPVGGNNALAREFSLDIVTQFRWMTAEEIADTEVEELDPDAGGQGY